MKHNHLLSRLRYHVTGAIERGEGEAIVAIPSFTEVTLSDGEAEFMAHRSNEGKWIAAYAYKRDVDSGYYPPSWKWRTGLNPLFLHLNEPTPSKAVNSLRQRGFISHE